MNHLSVLLSALWALTSSSFPSSHAGLQGELAPGPLCVQSEVRAALANHVQSALDGERVVPEPPRVAPRKAALGSPGIVTADDIYVYEDTNGVLAGDWEFPQLTALFVEAANALMEDHGDEFDFVGVWLNYDSVAFGAAFYAAVSSDVTGIGASGVFSDEEIFDFHDQLGLAGEELEGFVMMWNVNNAWWAPGDGADALFTRLVLAQEMEHRFGMFLDPLPGGLTLEGDNAACGRTNHWSWRVDAQGSGMECSEWVGSSPATLDGSFLSFNTDIPGGIYSYPDLYLMGYVTPEEMDAGASELRYMLHSDCSSDYAGPIVPFSSSDIVAVSGPRVPAAADAQHHFRTAWIMLHLPGDPPSAEELDKAVGILNQQTADYEYGTLGRGTMDNTLPKPGVVTPYGCGVNTVGSLTVLGGEPTLGESITLGLDNPLGSQSAGTQTFLGVALQPDAGFPCGTLVPGYGMTPGGQGEVLIDLSKLALVLVGSPWSGVAGMPVPMELAVPQSAALLGISIYVQGLMIDPNPTGGVESALTGALELLLGS